MSLSDIGRVGIAACSQGNESGPGSGLVDYRVGQRLQGCLTISGGGVDAIHSRKWIRTMESGEKNHRNRVFPAI